MTRAFFLWLLPYLLACSLSMPLSLLAQNVYISKYVSGIPGQPNDRIHRIELFNESGKEFQDLSGYFLMTRNYLFQFPPQTYIRPLQSFRLGYESVAGDLDLVYSRSPLWKDRQPQGSQGGNYAILFNPDAGVEDAFYFSWSETVDFLPSSEVWTHEEQENKRLIAPEEISSEWLHLKASQDPAFAFYRIAGRWQVGSRNKNILPAVQYHTPKISYHEGVVSLNWSTQEERDCFTHTVERSTDGKRYQAIVDLAGQGISTQEQEYTFFDTDIEQDRLYYYRIANTDKFGNVVFSTPVKIRSEEEKGGFALEILKGDTSTDNALNLRFSGKEEQQIRIQLMDEELREIAVLYYGMIEANKQNLIIYKGDYPSANTS